MELDKSLIQLTVEDSTQTPYVILILLEIFHLLE